MLKNFWILDFEFDLSFELWILDLMRRLRHRHFQKNESEHRKHQSLHKSYKQLQKQKGERNKIGNQKQHHHQKNFTGKNISK
jgi:hypothetical protein